MSSGKNTGSSQPTILLSLSLSGGLKPTSTAQFQTSSQFRSSVWPRNAGGDVGLERKEVEGMGGNREYNKVETVIINKQEHYHIIQRISQTHI